jgi:hypothetical protein
MSIPTKPVKASTPYDLILTFVGAAHYNVTEYAPDGSGGWNLSKVIQKDGLSTDPQHDAYSMTPIAAGDERLIVTLANMSTATGSGPVSMTTDFEQLGATVYTDTASGTDTGGPAVALGLRVVFQGT